MPFPFTLPTTSFFSYATCLSSPSHPSLPLTATTYRGVLREVLKKHKRLGPAPQGANLYNVLSALDEFLPYLFALDVGLSSPRDVAHEDDDDNGEEPIDIILENEVEVEWRATLTATIPGREPPRAKLRSLESEIAMVLSTMAYTHTLLARNQIHDLYGPTIPGPEQRTTAVQTATRHLLLCSSIHAYVAARVGQWVVPSPIVDMSTAVQTTLASLALAEATLLAVLKDDPYAAAVARERSKLDSEWMIKAPDMPKVRAHLFARLCVAAAEHADKASGMLGAAGKGALDDALLSYVRDLRRCARAKACRFLGIDADLGGETGKAIAWLRAGKIELGDATGATGEGPARSLAAGLGRLKTSFHERREDRRIEKGAEWGLDAGRLEELRINNMLETKWEKINDTIHAQLIPSPSSLLPTIPSGRNVHTVPSYQPPSLDRDILVRMRGPPEEGEAGDYEGLGEGSGSD